MEISRSKSSLNNHVMPAIKEAMLPLAAQQPARVMIAQTLIDNRKPNCRIELLAVHPSPRAQTGKGPWVAQFCAAATGPPMGQDSAAVSRRLQTNLD